MQTTLQNSVNEARAALEAGRQRVNAAKTALTEATESHERVQAALGSNLDDSDETIARLVSEQGKALARCNQATARLKQVEAELPALEQAVTDAAAALKEFMAGKFAVQICAVSESLRSKLGDVLSLLTELKRVADDSGTASGLPADKLIQLHTANALQGIDLGPLQFMGAPAQLEQLALDLYASPGSTNAVELKALVAVAQPGEIVTLALQNIDPIPILRARTEHSRQAGQEQWFIDVRSKLADLAERVVDEVEGQGDREQILATKFAIGEIGKSRRSAGLQLSAFEAEWSRLPAPSYRMIGRYTSKTYDSYCRQRDLLEREQGFTENRSAIAGTAQPRNDVMRPMKFTADGTRLA